MGQRVSKIVYELEDCGLIEHSMRDNYVYALQMCTERMITVVSMLLIGFALGKLVQGVLLLGTLFLLRRYTGGIHARTFMWCFTISDVIYATALYFEDVLLKNADCLMFALMVISGYIFVFGALNHPYMNYDAYEIEAARRKARYTLLLLLAIIAGLRQFGSLERYALYMAFGVILCGIGMLLSNIITREK